jgi:hypothetical protein
MGAGPTGEGARSGSGGGGVGARSSAGSVLGDTLTGEGVGGAASIAMGTFGATSFETGAVDLASPGFPAGVGLTDGLGTSFAGGSSFSL